MKRASIRLVPVAVLIVLAVAGAALAPQGANSSSPVRNKILAHKLAVALGTEKAKAKEMSLSGGVTYAMLERTGALNKRAAKWLRTPKGRAAMKALREDENGRLSSPDTEGCQNVFHGHGMTNTRVNQDCSLRRQAEETIQLNPLNEKNIIAGQNDSRIGFNHCGYDWSFDGGKNWGDQIPPFWQFVLLDDHTADACSDPTATWDSRGNAYSGGILFDINSDANAVVVMKSNAGNGGAFYHSPNPAGGFQEYRTTPVGVVANDITDFNDKELMTADQTPSSPKRDNVYMTWTKFLAAGHSPIYFSQSTNGGATWSAGIEISGSNATLCPVANTPAGPCNDNQGSHPVVGPDGTVYVGFANGNVPGAGIQQVLLVKCPASADCSNQASWQGPFKVGDMISTHPVGGGPYGCPGRQCLPPNGYRVPDETTVTVSVDKNSKLFVTWADHRNNTNPDCELGAPAGGSPPCDHDIFYAYSTTGGTTWSATRNITPRSRFGENAQWQSWSEVTRDGKTLWVAYYDRHYGNCEFTGCNDITAVAIKNPTSSSPSYDYTRVTTASMPNLLPSNNPIQAGFLGDYMWVDTDKKGDAHVVWADTRPIRGTSPEEDVYYAQVHRSGDDH
jgi:hypothetical protein